MIFYSSTVMCLGCSLCWLPQYRCLLNRLYRHISYECRFQRLHVPLVWLCKNAFGRLAKTLLSKRQVEPLMGMGELHL